MVNPENLRFTYKSEKRVEDLISDNNELINDALEMKMQDLYRNQAMLTTPNLENTITKILQNKSVSDIINFN